MSLKARTLTTMAALVMLAGLFTAAQTTGQPERFTDGMGSGTMSYATKIVAKGNTIDLRG